MENEWSCVLENSWEESVVNVAGQQSKTHCKGDSQEEEHKGVRMALSITTLEPNRKIMIHHLKFHFHLCGKIIQIPPEHYEWLISLYRKLPKAVIRNKDEIIKYQINFS